MCTDSRQLQPYVHSFKTTATLCAQSQDICNPMCTFSRQLLPYVHSFKTTATLCTQSQDICNPICTVSRQLHPCVHSFITVEPLRLQLRVSYRWCREVDSTVFADSERYASTEMLWYNCLSVSDITKPTCASAFLIRPYTYTLHA